MLHSVRYTSVFFYLFILMVIKKGDTKINLLMPFFFFLISVPMPDEEKKSISIFIFVLLCGASKCFMKVFKVFIKPFEAPQRGVKIKICINFYFNTLF